MAGMQRILRSPVYLLKVDVTNEMIFHIVLHPLVNSTAEAAWHNLQSLCSPSALSRLILPVEGLPSHHNSILYKICTSRARYLTCRNKNRLWQHSFMKCM